MGRDLSIGGTGMSGNSNAATSLENIEKTIAITRYPLMYNKQFVQSVAQELENYSFDYATIKLLVNNHIIKKKLFAGDTLVYTLKYVAGPQDSSESAIQLVGTEEVP